MKHEQEIGREQRGFVEDPGTKKAIFIVRVRVEIQKMQICASWIILKSCIM